MSYDTKSACNQVINLTMERDIFSIKTKDTLMDSRSGVSNSNYIFYMESNPVSGHGYDVQ